MQKKSRAEVRNPLLLCLFILGVMAALVILPYEFPTEAGNKKKGLFTRTESAVPGLDNFDIREDKSEASMDALLRFRQSVGKDAAAIADVRQEFVRGEDELRTRIPTLKVDYSTDLRIPQVITPNVWDSKFERMTSASNMTRAEILRNFIKQNNSLIGITDEQANALKVTADYTNPNGYLSFAHLQQEINGIPVYLGEIKAGFTKSGEMIRVINNVTPGIDYSSISNDFGDPTVAVRKAFGYINAEPTKLDVLKNDAASNDLKVIFGNGDWATQAEKMYFPTEVGVARPSWRVLIWQPVNAFYVIVDAETGTLLSRINITADQAQTATYNVYTNPNAFINSAESPAPLTPYPGADPTTGSQGTLITRNNVTLIGNEAPNWGQNNLGWITDGANITDGNNVEAGIDRDGTNGVDAPQTGSPNRTFNSPTWNPPPGSPTPGDDPLTSQAQRGAVIQMFYVMNLYHDILYNLGFTEPARNFQNDNFGRGGVANDRISAEGQDSSGTNNANFSITSDGTRGRMQMFLWTGPTPDYDGTTDADIIIHEVTHGTSGRLHNNALGNQGGMMGEGWGDWYAHTLLAEPSDPIMGAYSMGGYALFEIVGLPGFHSNYYYGIRKWPKAVIAFTGGPARPGCNNQPCPHNPLSFRHINSNCFTELGSSSTANISAFPMTGAQSVVISTSCSQVHNAGEIWSTTLWEVRALMVQRLGFSAGTRRVLQVVTDGMKLAPPNPMFLQERDAIIAAASALPSVPEASADVADVREGFRRRGMGFSASTQSATQVTEAFDTPNVIVANTGFSVSDTPGDNDGYPEPGENVLLNIPITNPSTGAAITNVMVNVNGGTNVNYGTIADGATVTMAIPYSIPSGSVCGSLETVTINVSSSAGTQTPTMRSFRLGAPTFGGSSQNFDGVTAPTLPAGFENVLLTGTGINWVTTATGPSSAPNSAFANDPATLNDATLVTTAKITSATAQIAFKNKFTLENTFDGAVLEYSTDSGANWTDVCPSCASICPGANCPFVSGGYTQTISTNFQSPIAGRRAWSGTQASYTDTVINLPATLNGQVIQLRWRMASDVSVASTGINIDDIVLTGGQFLDTYVCQVTPNAVESRSDFDGDGKSDVSVFRGSEGNWYLNKSTQGFAVANWGLSGDKLVPGDYDGDNKTDIAVFRANADASQPDFYILNSSNSTFSGLSWGVAGDIPVVRDYNGDDKEDVALFRPSNNTWYIINSGGTPAANTITVFGQAGDVPVAGDYDGDGKGDLAVYRSGTWIAQLSGGGSFSTPFGSAGDILVPADYDGDNKDDIAVFRPSTGQWIYISSMTSSNVTVSWGTSGDVPVPGDYDGDGKDDPAIYRNGQWWMLRSTSGAAVVNFGLSADTPTLKGYIP